MSENELKAQFKRVEAAWQTAYKMQEEKVQLATQTYEMVNKFIKKLIIIYFILMCIRYSNV